MTKDINEYKNEARRLHKHLAGIFPDATYAQALEAVAALHGAANWRTLLASPPQPEAPCTCGPITPRIEALAEKYAGGNVWGEHPRYPRSDWAYAAENGDTWQSYWIWLEGMLEGRSEEDDPEDASPRYFISEGWGHIFSRHEETVRWVFDTVENRIVFLQIHRNIGDFWEAASPAEIADVQDSLKNSNDELFDNPENWDVDTSDEMPDWAS